MGLSYHSESNALNDNPSFLYRYRSLDGDNLLFLERIFLHSEIYFTSPSQINDPFDCAVKLDFEAPDVDWRKFLLDSFKRRFPEISQEDRNQRVEEIIQAGRHRSQEIQKQIIGGLQESVNLVGLLCLTKRRDCILMWSHYTDGHSGICLEFRHHISEPFFGRAQKVNYLPFSKKPHAIFDNPMRQVELNLLSKARCWAYEDEWRIIDHDTGCGLKNFEPGLLTGVILGLNISDKHEKLILEWISKREPQVSLYKAKKPANGFHVKIEMITEN